MSKPEPRKDAASGVERLRIDADVSALPQLAAAFSAFASERLGTPSNSPALHDLKLAVREAATNLIEHGGLDPVEGAIEVALELRGRVFVVALTSEGDRFDPRRVTTEPPPPEALAEGGYGLYLIRSLADDVTYQSDGDRHTLELHKDLSERAM